MMFKVVLGYITSSSLSKKMKQTKNSKNLGWGEISHNSLYDPKVLGTLTLGTRPHSPKPHTDSPITLHGILTWVG